VHLRDPEHLRRHTEITDLSPDLVIENVFNPKPAYEYGPFTYVPQHRLEGSEQGEGGEEDYERVLQAGRGQEGGDPFEEGDYEDGLETPMIGRESRPGWLRARREKKEKERRQRVVTA
jgi:hypothetical protein